MTTKSKSEQLKEQEDRLDKLNNIKLEIEQKISKAPERSHILNLVEQGKMTDEQLRHNDELLDTLNKKLELLNEKIEITEVEIEQAIYQNVDSDHYEEDCYLNLFLEDNQDYYIKKFNRIQKSNSKASWNWVAFLKPSFWFAYRKMYGIAALSICLDMLTAIIPDFSFVYFVFAIISGIFGNYFYKQKADRECNAARQMDNETAYNYLNKKGGISLIKALLFNVIVALVFALIYMLIFNYN